MAAQARPERAAAARRAFCPPPEFADPMERPVPLPLLLLSSFSLLAARGRGAPGPRPPPPDPHQGPALPGSLQLSVLEARALRFAALRRSSHGPQSCVESRPATSSAQPHFRLGPNALL